MRYLKLQRYDGRCDYVPLEIVQFEFITTGDDEYRVYLRVSGTNCAIASFEQKIIPDVDACIMRFMDVSDKSIINPVDLIY
jgi:hypothetical protein